MNNDKKRRIAMRALCADLGPEDGTDSKLFHQHKSNRRSADRKTGSLCRQARDALQLALSGAGSPALAEAMVVKVEPAPDASRLKVTVVSPDPEGAAQALKDARGWLRSEVASAIHRKRTPTLLFTVVS